MCKSTILVAVKLAPVAVLVEAAFSGYHFGCELHRVPFAVELSLVLSLKHHIVTSWSKYFIQMALLGKGVIHCKENPVSLKMSQQVVNVVSLKECIKRKRAFLEHASD